MDRWSRHVDRSPGFVHDRIKDSASSRKRARESGDHINFDSDELLSGGTTPSRRPPGPRALDSKPSFACPYMKKDPTKYQRCRTLTLTRPRDVKQHLRRCHARPPYCALCYETFDTTGERDSHSRSGCKLRNSGWMPDGIPEEVIKELSKKPPKDMSNDDEAQWFRMFDILFPHHQPRPKSAYVDVIQSHDLAIFEAFLMADGPRIIADYLQVPGHVRQGYEQNIYTGLQAAFRQWRGESDFTRESTAFSSPSTLRNTPSVSSPASTTMYNPPSDTLHAILLQQDTIPESAAASFATEILAPSMYPTSGLEANRLTNFVSPGTTLGGGHASVNFGDPQSGHFSMGNPLGFTFPGSMDPWDGRSLGQM